MKLEVLSRIICGFSCDFPVHSKIKLNKVINKKGVTFMPVAGTYKIRVKTPKGVQEGKLTLVVQGDSLSGTLKYSAGSSEIKDGRVKGNAVEFTTKIKTPVGPLKALVKGVVEGDSFSGVAKLPMGSAQVDGIRIS
ncbi:MAG: hypothetical protein AAGU75_02225 [Bacillota bacterium]